MKLDENQKKLVAKWVNSGATLSEIQTQISENFKISMTYMDVRFLVDDLNLDLLDPAVPEEKKSAVPEEKIAENPAPENAPNAGKISISVDPVQAPGVFLGGKVKFSDGVEGRWFLDSSGRLGLENFPENYRPPQQDAPEFQTLLRQELAKLGY